MCSIESRLQLLVVVQGLVAIHTLVGNLMLHAVARRGLDPVSRRAASPVRAGGLHDCLGRRCTSGVDRDCDGYTGGRKCGDRGARGRRHATGWG